jgi:hypothetical protein
LAGQNNNGVNLNNVFEEAAELGDGGDRDAEGDNARDSCCGLDRLSFQLDVSI